MEVDRVGTSPEQQGDSPTPRAGHHPRHPQRLLTGPMLRYRAYEPRHRGRAREERTNVTTGVYLAYDRTGGRVRVSLTRVRSSGYAYLWIHPSLIETSSPLLKGLPHRVDGDPGAWVSLSVFDGQSPWTRWVAGVEEMVRSGMPEHRALGYQPCCTGTEPDHLPDCRG